MTRSPSDRWFRRLLRLFPCEFRGDFGDQMAADFRDQHADAAERSKSRAALWVRTVAAFVGRAPIEHLDIFRRDLGCALRILRYRPAFTVTALLTLAIGIGLNTAVYSVVSAVLWRELPLPASNRLVHITGKAPTVEAFVSPHFAHVDDWRAHSKTLDTFSRVVMDRFILNGDRYGLYVMKVDRGFFPLTGAQLSLGRPFADDDFAESAGRSDGTRIFPHVVILAHNVWQERFGARPSVIGERIAVNGGVSEVVGVLAPAQPYTRVRPWFAADLVVPLLDTEDSSSGQPFVGRLASGATIAAAQAELSAIADRTGETIESARGWHIRVISLRDGQVTRSREQLLFLLGTAAVVLLIACANLTTLLLSHASGRQAEISMRAALGATRGQLIRQIVTESLVLTVTGAAIGFLVSMWAVPLLVAAVPAGEVPRLHEVTVDGRILAFSAVIAIVVGVICGLGACLSLNRLAHVVTHRTAQMTHGGRRLRVVLAASAMAFALMLVVATSLMVRTLQALNAVELGFDPTNVLSVSLDVPDSLENPAAAALRRDIVDEVRSLPGVLAAGVGPAPIGGGIGGVGIRLPTAIQLRNQESSANVYVGAFAVSGGYFEALNATLVEGRFLQDSDVSQSPGPVVIDENAAQWLWSGRSPVGETFWRGREEFQVVGVVKHIRRRMEFAGEPWVFFHHLQQGGVGVWQSEMVVRVDRDPMRLAPPILERITRIAGRSRESDVTTLGAHIDVATAQRRFIRSLTGLFSLIALALALVGIYGILAESVAQRVPEIGVRMALGATPGNVTRLFLRQGAWIIAIGLTLGLAGAFGLHRTMTTLVFGVETLDPPAFIAAVLCLLVTATLACAIPARRAARLDPVAALRQE